MGGTRVDANEESAQKTDPLLGQTDWRQVRSTDQPLQSDEPGPAPARRSETDQGERRLDVDGRETNNKRLCSGSGMEVPVGSGHSRVGNDEEKVEGPHPSPSTPSILHGGEAEGT